MERILSKLPPFQRAKVLPTGSAVRQKSTGGASHGPTIGWVGEGPLGVELLEWVEGREEAPCLSKIHVVSAYLPSDFAVVQLQNGAWRSGRAFNRWEGQRAAARGAEHQASPWAECTQRWSNGDNWSF